MNTTEQILLVILSTFLAVFLLLSILLVASLIKLSKKMQEVADKAHEAVGRVEDVSDMFKKTVGPLALGKFFVNVAEAVAKHKKGK
jgi:sensor domain CHASE-containing protein